MKTPYKERLRAAEYKRNNWPKVRDYAREYMSKYRRTPKGARVVRDAQQAYMDRVGNAFAMYQVLRRLMIQDGVFLPGRPVQAKPSRWKVQK